MTSHAAMPGRSTWSALTMDGPCRMSSLAQDEAVADPTASASGEAFTTSDHIESAPTAVRERTAPTTTSGQSRRK
jgi:hypothetical protein